MLLAASAFSPADLILASLMRNLGRAPCTGSHSLYKHWDSFYSLDSCQITHQTTWSQKQQGYARIELSYRQRQNCLYEYGLVGWIIMNREVQKSPPHTVSSHVSEVWELIYICLNSILLDYVESAAVAWHYHQQADCNISNMSTTRIIPAKINSACFNCLDSWGSAWLADLYTLDLWSKGNCFAYLVNAGASGGGVVVWVLFRVTRLTWLWEECPLVATGLCYVENLDRLTDYLRRLMSERSGLAG